MFWQREEDQTNDGGIEKEEIEIFMSLPEEGREKSDQWKNKKTSWNYLEPVIIKTFLERAENPKMK